MSHFQTTVNTSQSGLVKAFPWRTSAVSAKERKKVVHDAMLGSIHVQEVKDMVEVLAEQVDDAATMTIHDAFTRDFVRDFLVVDNPDLTPEDALSTMVEFNRSPSLSNIHVLSAAQIFFRYVLLDVCADAYDLPPAESNRSMAHPFRPSCAVEKLNKTVESLKDWPNLITKFYDMYSAVQGGLMGQAPPTIPNANANQRMFVIGLQSLKRAHAHQASKHFDKVMFNIEILSFAIWWIRMGFPDFPRDQNDLMEQLKSQCQHLNMPPEILNSISNLSDMASTSTMASSMRNVLHVALSISPLLVLVPKKLSIVGIRRDHLITHAISLGKDKPKELQNAERATWLFAFNLSAGLDKMEQLERYLERLRPNPSTAVDAGVADWFILKPQPAIEPSLVQSATAHQPKRALPQLPLQTVTPHDSTPLANTPPASLNNTPVDTEPQQGIDDQSGHESNAVTHGAQLETIDAIDDQSDHESNAVTHGARLETIDEEDEENEENDDFETSTRQLRSKTRGRAVVVDKKRGNEAKHKSGSTNKEKKTLRNRLSASLLKVPDLPLPAVSESPEQYSRTPKSVTPIADVDPEELSAQGISVRLHCANRDHPPVDFEFSAPKASAKVEYRLLAKIQKAVVSQFISGRPPHHTDGAQSVNDTSMSAFFVTNEKAFSKLTPMQIQRIFRRRHILIPATSCPEIKFDRHGLSTLGCLTTERQIQVNAEEKKLYSGTLLDLLEGDTQGNRRVLNALDIKMGGAPIPPPPGYSHLASNEQAWQATRDLPAMTLMAFPSDEMQWGTAATTNATSLWHLDDYGLGTVVHNIAGKKYWVVAREKNPKHEDGYGNMASRFAFSGKWDQTQAGDKYWDLEGVVLEPGDILYMRPNTMHYVVTMEDSFSYGRHFLSSSTIQDTVSCIVHCFIFGIGITNTQHDGLGTLLRRMMSMWHVHYDQASTFMAPQDAHIPDISTVDGLVDLMALGNLLELAQVVDRRSYQKGIISWQELEEMAMARWRYRLLQKIFEAKFLVFTRNQEIHAMSVFRRSLVEFAAALVHYKDINPQPSPKLPACTPAAVKAKVTGYFMANFPELLPPFNKSLDAGAHTFTWSGPKLTLGLRDSENLPASGEDGPRFNFNDLILYEGIITVPQKRSNPSLAESGAEDDDEIQIVEESSGANPSDPNPTNEPPPHTRADDADDNIEMADGTLENASSEVEPPPTQQPTRSDQVEDNVEMDVSSHEQLQESSQAGPSLQANNGSHNDNDQTPTSSTPLKRTRSGNGNQRKKRKP